MLTLYLTAHIAKSQKWKAKYYIMIKVKDFKETSFYFILT